MQIDKRLREIDHGAWEGRNLHSLLNDAECGYREWLADPSAVVVPDAAETIMAAQSRVLACVAECSTYAPAEKVLLVTHKHVRAVLMCGLLEVSFERFSEHVHDEVAPGLIPPPLIYNLLGRATG